MARLKQILAISAIPVVAIGWLAFRPELLFVNKKVNEQVPTASNASVTILSTGSFESYAHETKGMAQISEVKGENILSLTNFKTSNGPDVHVYLVKGSNADQESVNKSGYLDLGIIKGNQGNQNYTIPAGTNLSEYSAVAIWCKRFGVDFGGATLKAKPTAFRFNSTKPLVGGTLASYGADIEVTSGKFKGATGSAALIEADGKRFLKLNKVKASGKNLHVYFLKLESKSSDEKILKAEKVDLGALPTSGNGRLPVSKDLDAWLYRSVAIWDTKANKSVGFAELRSAQERTSAEVTNFNLV